ncbi:MAG: flagellar protein export ATPase FliI [Proteobacteria bacterium]|nr:flagellar protein export ATPase FliI [Pseudomonadota bacterium]
MAVLFKNIADQVERLPALIVSGQVTAISGLLVEISGLDGYLSIGDHCRIEARDGRRVICEVVGFRDGQALVLPFGTLAGIGLGCRAEVGTANPIICPDMSWLGRVVNAFGEPIDGKGPLRSGLIAYPIHNAPPPAHLRRRIGDKVDLGVRAMNAFLTVCNGQRMGIFAGSGVGKSTMLSMMARYTSADVSVIGLVGERGREAREFLDDDLGEDGLARSVVVVATSDEPPLVRRQAAYMTMTIAEYFRDQSRDVLCLMDSVTRFAMAQREISLSAGEPPATRGYTPTVFAELPRLLERAGPGVEGQGSITGLFAVLVEGDDHNEPIADAVRGILDGHVVLDRAIAERGRYPAVNVLRSVSRTMPECNTAEQNALVERAKRLIATYDDMAELIRLGAYRQGSDVSVDEAIYYFPAIEEFMRQTKDQQTGLEECYRALATLLDQAYDGPNIPQHLATQAPEVPLSAVDLSMVPNAPPAFSANQLQQVEPDPTAEEESDPMSPAEADAQARAQAVVENGRLDG